MMMIPTSTLRRSFGSVTRALIWGPSLWNILQVPSTYIGVHLTYITDQRDLKRSKLGPGSLLGLEIF
ncbi:Protein of unknown function [Pyronema omphalodes CBS 100304]|uniref:Uncharacterized protein n=1 Tax=Pyronema omphalodes (strain CBS 100304) TaxID=1076935 RepID=U4KXJ8_PYROM|nr:Protein of unknown function [Pyronema omphalodes CBS 100304]